MCEFKLLNEKLNKIMKSTSIIHLEVNALLSGYTKEVADKAFRDVVEEYESLSDEYNKANESEEN